MDFATTKTKKNNVTSTKILSRIFSKRSSVMHLSKMYQVSICGFHHHHSFLHGSFAVKVVVIVTKGSNPLKSFQSRKYKENQSIIVFGYSNIARRSILEQLPQASHLPALHDIYASKNFRRYCRHLTYVHPFEQLPCNATGCQRKYICVRSLV